MTKIIWLLPETVIAMHEEQLAEHGGDVDIRSWLIGICNDETQATGASSGRSGVG